MMQEWVYSIFTFTELPNLKCRIMSKFVERIFLKYLDESISGRDLYGELAFLGRSLEKVREEMRRIMSELQECGKIVG